MNKPTFTKDWFTHNVKHWEKHVLSNIDLTQSVRWLELGSYEGRSALWAYNAIGHNPLSQVHCVDIWRGSYEANFDANVRGCAGILKHKEDCFEFLVRELAVGQAALYDVIYIDADHQAKSVITDACLCWRLLKPGGVMIFDDYQWQHPADTPDRWHKLPPKEGIDAFLKCWQHEIIVLHVGWQVIIKKN